MRRALDLAQQQGKYASPNPKVGAVVVAQGRIVGEGAHRQYGGLHAEALALRKAGSRARGATLYVTLEPCSHYGKTPPCVDAVIESGVRRVVACMRDPYPLVQGRGFQRLEAAGVRVERGLLEKEARQMNGAFLESIRRGRPRVLLKAAISLDGKIATVSGASKWITGDKARRRAHLLRSQADAILVGSRTVLKDDPSLDVRLPGFHRRDGWPLRVVLDSGLRTPLTARIFQGRPQTLVFTSPRAPAAKVKVLEKKGVRVFPVPFHQKMLSLRAVLKILHSLHVRTLLVEGGGEVHASFLREKLADEVALFIAPKILGGRAATWVAGKGVENPGSAPKLKGIRIEKIGEDHLWTGQLGD